MQRLYMSLRKRRGRLGAPVVNPPPSPSQEGLSYWLVRVGRYSSNGFFVDLGVVFDRTMT